ncbi:large ribosomal subunit protein uL15m-like [Liolophura sinensis]|uniref:large ribosomal subunit protein uL15m-like n=1 Tax=Liolophura sinensis TaxID=3198878 RepID=UPI0031580466
MASVERALRMLRNLPRVAINNIKCMPGSRKRETRRRGFARGRTHGRGTKGQGQSMTLPRLGFEGGQTPFYLRIPQEPYYHNQHLRRQYLPLSLLQIQRMVDLGRLDTTQPIDLTALCNTQIVNLQIERKQYGVNLTDEGADIFKAKINLEVQWTSEQAIAAVEKNGGVITTRFYDPVSLYALRNPKHFFQKGVPIPRCKLPPQDAIEYYSDAKSRGYLADPAKIREARFELAQKYGYDLPDLAEDELYEMFLQYKDPRQIFYGLEPGWVVNLKDQVVLKPKSQELLEYYRS